MGRHVQQTIKNHFLHDFLMDVQASPLWKDTKIALTVVFMLLHLYCTLEFEIIVADVLNDLFPWLLMTADKQSWIFIIDFFINNMKNVSKVWLGFVYWIIISNPVSSKSMVHVQFGQTVRNWDYFDVEVSKDIESRLSIQYTHNSVK